jgi:hypothetical protein
VKVCNIYIRLKKELSTASIAVSTHDERNTKSESDLLQMEAEPLLPNAQFC